MMRGGRKAAFLTLSSLTIATALTGCAWLSRTFSSSEAPEEPVAQTAPAPATATPIAQQPASAAPAPVETALPATSSNGFKEIPGAGEVKFRSGQVGVVKADQKVLDGVVRWVKENPGAIVLVEGHSDDLGTREENHVVAEKRANSIMRYLIARGLEPARISTTSVGADRPVCTEKSDTCRAKNRRARVLVKTN
jgi:peptidoglycan-associated lipoprotein